MYSFAYGEHLGENGEVEDHYLLFDNWHLVQESDNKIYNIEKVNVHFIYNPKDEGLGYVLGLLIEHNNSHGFIYWENINCTSDLTADLISKAHNRFKLSK